MKNSFLKKQELPARNAAVSGKTTLVQPKLTINQPGDRYEQEADHVAESVMRMKDGETPVGQRMPLSPVSSVQRQSGGEAGGRAAPPVVSEVLNSGGGKSLDASTQQFMESRFGQNFSKVKIHDGEMAAESASAIQAKAYTSGSDIVFNKGEYQPGSESGRRLLAHELAHVGQQGEGATVASGSQIVQRDLRAYNVPVSGDIDVGLFGADMTVYSPEGPGLKTALAGLIAAGKVDEMSSKDGQIVWFGVKDHTSVSELDIESALSVAGYAKASVLARAIYAQHDDVLYSKESVISSSYAGFGSTSTTTPRDQFRLQDARPLTSFEVQEARKVFGRGIKYGRVIVHEGSLKAQAVSIGGAARTVGNNIYMPINGSQSMGWLIHELTHVLQYQYYGWSYAVAAVKAQMGKGYDYTENGLNEEDSLNAARARGKKLHDYNMEQQGDILQDYYEKLPASANNIWEDFAKDIPGR